MKLMEEVSAGTTVYLYPPIHLNRYHLSQDWVLNCENYDEIFLKGNLNGKLRNETWLEFLGIEHHRYFHYLLTHDLVRHY